MFGQHRYMKPRCNHMIMLSFIRTLLIQGNSWAVVRSSNPAPLDLQQVMTPLATTAHFVKNTHFRAVYWFSQLVEVVNEAKSSRIGQSGPKNALRESRTTQIYCPQQSLSQIKELMSRINNLLLWLNICYTHFPKMAFLCLMRFSAFCVFLMRLWRNCIECFTPIFEVGAVQEGVLEPLPCDRSILIPEIT